jgi:hypothetical protein
MRRRAAEPRSRRAAVGRGSEAGRTYSQVFALDVVNRKANPDAHHYSNHQPSTK